MKARSGSVRCALLAIGLLTLAACGDDRGGGGGRTSSGKPLLKVVLQHGNNSRPYMPLPEEVAKQVAGDLEEVGFRVEIRKEEWSTFLSLVQGGEHQMALFGWTADVPDADNFLYVLLDKTNARTDGSASNVSFYSSDEAHKYLEAARYEYDAAKRLELYKRAQQQAFDDVPVVPLVYVSQFLGVRKGFGPLQPEPVQHPLLRLCERPKDGTLRYVRGSDSVKLDPANATDGESSAVIEQIFEGLVRFAPGSTKVEPALATEWHHAEDGLTWTFRIRPNVRFHDGTPCDVAAVVAAFERQRDPKHPLHVTGDYAYWQDLLAPYVAKVEPGPQDDEVTFRMSRPAPAFFLACLATFAMGIPSPKAVAERGADVARFPVGTGPFRFVSWSSGNKEIELARNDAWWGGAVALAKAYYQVSADPTARTQALLAGQADVIDNIALDTLATLKASKGVEVVERPGVNCCYLAMNTKKPPFDDPRVRRAVAYAIDKARIVEAAYAGFARPATNLMPPTIPGFHDGIKDRVRDPAKARELLEEALGNK